MPLEYTKRPERGDTRLTNFGSLWSLYEKQVNTSDLCQKNGAIRFLKIRSLRKVDLKGLLNKFGIKFSNKSSYRELREAVYKSDIPSSFFDAWINAKFSEVKSKRLKDPQKVHQSVKDVRSVKCGIRDDNVNSIIKKIVRDKSIETLDKLENSVDGNALPQIKSYIMWSWYNQKTNDLVELAIYDHPKVLPTLRRVHGVDFFLKMNNEDIPFDFKLSYIPQSFFDYLREKNRRRTEEKVLKDFFKDQGETIGGRSLPELARHITNTPALRNSGGKSIIEDLLEWRKRILKEIFKEPKPLCSWLYHDQGPRLFNNNNRFFVVLVDKNSFEKPWKLKAEIGKIKSKVYSYLDNLTENEILVIEYTYNKHERYKGKYRTRSCITFFEN